MSHSAFNSNTLYYNEQMMDAAYSCNLSRVEQYLQLGADINFAERLPILLVAVENNCIDIVKYLIKNGAELSVTNEQGLDILSFAISKDKQEIINYLLSIELSFDLNQALLQSIIQRNFDLIEKLVRLGANLERYSRFVMNKVLTNNNLFDDQMYDYLYDLGAIKQKLSIDRRMPETKQNISSNLEDITPAKLTRSNEDKLEVNNILSNDQQVDEIYYKTIKKDRKVTNRDILKLLSNNGILYEADNHLNKIQLIKDRRNGNNLMYQL